MASILVDQVGSFLWIRLNRPEGKHALNTEMFHALEATLSYAKENKTIRAILLDSTTEDAFCAGGDIKEIREGCIDPEKDHMALFELEYRVDKMVMDFPKPVVAYWRGITMGGGLGLSIDADRVLVEEDARLAMPETRLGIVPDVAMGYYFSKMERPLGLYLTMTGREFTGVDAAHFGWADILLPSGDHDEVVEKILSLDLERASEEEILLAIDDAIRPEALSPKKTTLMEDLSEIRSLFDEETPAAIFENLRKSSTDFSKKTLKTMEAVCPLSLGVCAVKYLLGKDWSRRETFEKDLIAMDLGCTTKNAEEGIRTTLIDREDVPTWHPSSIEEVDLLALEMLFREGEEVKSWNFR